MWNSQQSNDDWAAAYCRALDRDLMRQAEQWADERDAERERIEALNRAERARIADALRAMERAAEEVERNRIIDAYLDRLDERGYFANEGDEE